MNMPKTLLHAEWYLTHDVLSAAKNLLGMILRSEIDGHVCEGIIVETEAYRGADDRGCHSYGNKITERNRTMFDIGGSVYVYICYGIHPMLNVVIGNSGVADAVLIRAVEPIQGLKIMMERRDIDSENRLKTTSGPGNLANAFGINKLYDGDKFFDPSSPIQIFSNGIKPSSIYEGHRVGMSARIGTCAFRPWRFYIEGNVWVSNPKHIDYTQKTKFSKLCNI